MLRDISNFWGCAFFEEGPSFGWLGKPNGTPEAMSAPPRLARPAEGEPRASDGRALGPAWGQAFGQEGAVASDGNCGIGPGQVAVEAGSLCLHISAGADLEGVSFWGEGLEG